MNTEQLRAEFEEHITQNTLLDITHAVLDAERYVQHTTQRCWESFQAAAKSRDELIGKWLKQLSAAYNLCTPFECGDGLAHTINTILAEAAAQGYGE